MTETGYQRDETGREVGRYLRVELREQDDLKICGRADAADHLRGPDGAVRAGALLTLLDQVGGLCAGVASLPDGWVVSTNLAARIVATDHTGPFRVDSSVLRRGRNSVVTSAQIFDEGADDALVADGVLTSAILVPDNGPPVWERPIVVETGRAAGADAPRIPEWLDVRPLDDTAIEIDLAEEFRNPWGILHGGVVAMLVDLAGEHVAGGSTTDVVLHFIAPNRVGPVRAIARSLGRRSDGEVVRVEIRDEGANRTTALAITTVK